MSRSFCIFSFKCRPTRQNRVIGQCLIDIIINETTTSGHGSRTPWVLIVLKKMVSVLVTKITPHCEILSFGQQPILYM